MITSIKESISKWELENILTTTLNKLVEEDLKKHQLTPDNFHRNIIDSDYEKPDWEAEEMPMY